MKKLTALALAVLMIVSVCCTSALALGMPNPWEETDAQGLRQLSGLSFRLPENAEDVAFRYLADEQLAEIQFTVGGAQCCYRMAPADTFEDISGVYTDWNDQVVAQVGICSGILSSNATAARVQWYDTLPGVVYSLLVNDPAEPDALELANAIYVPRMSLDTVFADLAEQVFYFSSGVGGWFTELSFAPDGSFTGFFHDSEMGEMGEEYPNGSVYGCSFHGKASMLEQVSEYVLRISIDSLELDEGQLPEYIEDGIRYVTSDSPYGLENAKDLLVYLPDMPVSELPEGYLMWSHLNFMDPQPEQLPFYGLYNETDECGFVGDPRTEPAAVG